MRGYQIGLSFLGLALAAAAWSAGQEPPPPPTPAAKVPQRDPAKFSLLQRHVHLSAQRGSEWLLHANRPDGRFVYGLIPALKAPLEGDDYLAQWGGTLSLARAAGYFGAERAAAVARQALLTLLLETTVDANEPDIRHPTLPSTLVNRLGAAGLLVAAVHELPAAGKDLLDQADQ